MSQVNRGLEKKVDEILVIVDFLKSSVSEIKMRVESLDDRVSKLESRFAEFEYSLSKLESRVKNIEISYDSIALGSVAGEDTRKKVRMYRTPFYSSPAGFNARGWVKGRGY